MGNTMIRYLDDSSGQRIQKIENEGTADEVIHDYGWEDGHIVFEKAGTKINRYYFDETGSPVAMSLGSDKYIFQKNLQGDIIGVYDADGTLLVRYRYDAWGKVQVTDTTASHSVIARNSYLYRGYWYDWDTGLYYLNSRYYDPETGRFLNADDVVLLGSNGDFTSYNLYLYCGNNATNRTDEAGTCWKLIRGLVGAAVNVVTTAIAAKATGQEYTIVDGLFAAASGFIGGYTKPLFGAIATGVIAGFKGYSEGMSFGQACAVGIGTAAITYFSIGTAVNAPVISELFSDTQKTIIQATCDSVFGVANDLMSAAIYKNTIDQKRTIERRHERKDYGSAGSGKSMIWKNQLY